MMMPTMNAANMTAMACHSHTRERPPFADKCRQRSPNVSARPPQPQIQVQKRLPCFQASRGITTNVPTTPAMMKNAITLVESSPLHQKKVLKNNGNGWYRPHARHELLMENACTAITLAIRKKPTWNEISEM